MTGMLVVMSFSLLPTFQLNTFLGDVADTTLPTGLDWSGLLVCALLCCAVPARKDALLCLLAYTPQDLYYFKILVRNELFMMSLTICMNLVSCWTDWVGRCNQTARVTINLEI